MCLENLTPGYIPSVSYSQIVAITGLGAAHLMVSCAEWWARHDAKISKLIWLETTFSILFLNEKMPIIDLPIIDLWFLTNQSIGPGLILGFLIKVIVWTLGCVIYRVPQGLFRFMKFSSSLQTFAWEYCPLNCISENQDFALESRQNPSASDENCLPARKVYVVAQSLFQGKKIYKLLLFIPVLCQMIVQSLGYTVGKKPGINTWTKLIRNTHTYERVRPTQSSIATALLPWTTQISRGKGK